jgi:hypothetical protein
MNLPMLSPRHKRVAVVAVALAAALPATALAIPPGGPGEIRNGATVSVSPRIAAPGGTLTIAGSGFTPGQAITVKLDDGLALPTTPAPGGSDVFLSLAADGSGNIPAGTTLDLDDVRAADQPAMQDGSHRLRILTSTPARSIHADFAVIGISLGPPENLVGSGPPPPVPSSGFVAPPESQLLEFPNVADPDLPYTDIPRLVAGSVVPFRFHDFPLGQLVTLKRNDAAANELQLMPDGSGDGAGFVTPDTSVPGTAWIRFLTGPPPNQRSVRAPYAIVPNGDGRDVKVTRQVLASGSVAYATKALTRLPVDYVPLSGEGQTFRAQVVGETPITQTANSAGVATGALALPPGVVPGAYTALFTIGFATQNDFPQAVFARAFDVVAELPAATAALAGATSLVGGTVSYTLGSFASNAGGGQKVGVYVDGVAAPVACADTDVAGDHAGSFALPASVGAGAATIRFVAGSQCVTGGAVTQPPARDIAQPLTVVAAAVPPLAPPPPPPVLPPPPPAATALSVLSKSLKLSKSGSITLSLKPASAAVKTAITVRTQKPVKLKKSSKRKKVVTIAKRSYNSSPGAASRAVKLTLTKDGKTLMRRLKTVLVRISVTPAGGKAVTKNVRLSR